MDRATAIRKLRGLRTQQEFANEMRVSRGTVIAWERGDEVSIRSARRLFAAGIDQSLLIFGRCPGTDESAA